MPETGEVIFCIACPAFDTVAAVLFFAYANGRTAILLFGVLTVIPGGEDSTVSART